MSKIERDEFQEPRVTLRRGRLSRREFVARFGTLGLLFPAVATFPGCRRESPDGDSASKSAGKIESELRVANRTNAIPETVMADFEKEFGVRVTHDLYTSSDDLDAKLLAGEAVYDVCALGGSRVSRLILADLLLPLDRSKLINLENLDATFLDAPWDPGNRFSVPYSWGMTGIAFRTDKVEVPPQDLSVFFDARYERKMTMLDDAREVLGAMLKRRGETQNSRDASKLEIAKQDAIAARKNLRGFVSGAATAQLIAGDVWVAQLGNGDAARAREEQPAIDWVLPKEGGNLWTDSLVILKNARHANAAHAFVDYVLRAEVAAAIAVATRYGTPNTAARAKLGRLPPSLEPEERKRLEYQVDLGRDQALWDRFWDEVKLAV